MALPYGTTGSLCSSFLPDRLVGLSVKHPCADFLAVEFFPIEPDRAFNSAAFDSVVHAIEAAQEGRLSAARWANERGYLIARHVHRYVVQRMERAIMQIEV